MPLCLCGCGKEVALYNQTNRKRGIVAGEPAKFVHGHNARGERNNNWKGGRHTDASGYVRVRSQTTKRGWEYEHRLIAEQMLGRSLLKGEVVHHKDGNKGNNDPKNLLVLPSQSEHRSIEQNGRTLTDEHRAKISEGVRRSWREDKRPRTWKQKPR